MPGRWRCKLESPRIQQQIRGPHTYGSSRLTSFTCRQVQVQYTSRPIPQISELGGSCAQQENEASEATLLHSTHLRRSEPCSSRGRARRGILRHTVPVAIMQYSMHAHALCLVAMSECSEMSSTPESRVRRPCSLPHLRRAGRCYGVRTV